MENTQIIKSEAQLSNNSTITPLVLRSYDEYLTFADAVVKSGLAPKGATKESCFITIAMGAELGLPPMQSIQNIACINNRPSLWGDSMLGLVRASGLLDSFSEEEIGGEWQGKNATAPSFGYKVTAKRVGVEAPAVEVFTIQDAKDGALWGKAGPWSTSPKRMLKMRARSFALRDMFPDVLKGLYTAEENLDPAFEVVDTPKKQTLFNKDDAVDADVSDEPKPTEAPMAEAEAPSEKEAKETSEISAIDELKEVLKSEGLKTTQCKNYCVKNGLLKADEPMTDAVAQRLIQGWNAVKTSIKNY